MAAEIGFYDFSLLPPHIITNILSYFPVHKLQDLATVCHSWYEASLDRKITKKVGVHFYGNSNTGRFLDTTTTVRPFANVDFNRTDFTLHDFRQFLGIFSNNIRHIEFNDCIIEFEQFIECIELLNNLESLTIETLKNTIWEVDTNISDTVTKHLSRVKTLSIACHSEKNFAAANFILSKCTNLKNLTYRIKLMSEDDKIWEDMIKAMEQWKRVDLKYLSIASETENDCSTFFTSFRILNVIRIKQLNLRNIQTFYDPTSFDQFCAGMYDIEDLDIDINTHSNLLSICQYLNKLKRLSINAMSTKQIGILEDLHNLEVLEVAAFDIPHNELLKVVNAQMPNLRKLSLNIMILNKQCLTALCNNFTELEYLNVTLDTNYLYPIYKYLHNLRHLTIYYEDKCEEDVVYEEGDCNILKLQKLERLYVDEWVPSMTADRIAQLPNLKYYKCMADAWANSKISMYKRYQ